MAFLLFALFGIQVLAQTGSGEWASNASQRASFRNQTGFLAKSSNSNASSSLSKSTGDCHFLCSTSYGMSSWCDRGICWCTRGYYDYYGYCQGGTASCRAVCLNSAYTHDTCDGTTCVCSYGWTNTGATCF
ncbi:unnamed protein product [Symbiodinium microadriaticum]|nr:unnamed protein product [Symbiodinium microadriaticum]CAE7947414.1 unnamed protein product [Symbiodinium sp. KB8]